MTPAETPPNKPDKPTDQAAVFDRHADEYDQLIGEAVGGTGFSPTHFHAYKVHEVKRFWAGLNPGGEPRTFLNFGCGTGASEPFIRRAFPACRICSTDISPVSLERAKEVTRELGNIGFKPFIDGKIPFTEKFDVIFAANVFHHIPHNQHGELFATIRDSLAPGGCFFIFEHNPANPLTRRAVCRCPFDRDAHLVKPAACRQTLHAAGFTSLTTRYTVFVPGCLKFLLPLERYLAWLPLGAQYFIAAGK